MSSRTIWEPLFPKLGIEIYESSPVVNKSKFSVVMFSGVFVLFASAYQLATTRMRSPVDSAKQACYLLTAGYKKVLSV